TAVDIGGLEPGTTNIDIAQLAQRDVFQSISFPESAKTSQMSPMQTSNDMGYDVTVTGNTPNNQADYDAYLNYVKSSGISIEVGGESFFFGITQNADATTFEDMGSRTVQDLAAEINTNDKFIASVENIGTDEYRLVIKSSESGKDNALTISQVNINLGFENNQYSAKKVADTSVQISGGETVGDKITINGIDFATDGKTYDELATEINDYNTVAGNSSNPGSGDTFTATIIDGQIVINTQDNSSLTISETGVDIGFYNSNDAHTQSAQNLEANVDGIDYNVASNTLTIQGNLTMTAVEVGKATIDIQKDTSAILNGLETMIASYNALVDLVAEEAGKADSVMNDNSSLRSIVTNIKNNLFGSYGKNNDLNLFNFGLELDLTGHLSVNSSDFGKALVENYDDIKNLFLGNTIDKDLASTDATKYMGMGTSLQNILDDLDSSEGTITKYEESIAKRKEKLVADREKALKSLDSKYDALASQFSLYGSAISQMESSFSGLSLMIEQSVAKA
ncbi:flagellar filament capping protein FliD, partial [Poseidonibacter sp.]|uniref:flagellar filament capping protein FliD n=1 Tax=Poseidonibacter sp. TaxID=2321188 RepID=UPI003C77BAB6